MAQAFEALVPLVSLVLLLSLRTGAALATLPAPLGSQAPMIVRAALGVMIAMAIAVPLEGASLPESVASLDPFALGGAALGEMAVGMAIGLVARSAIATAEVAGEIAASAMGLSFAAGLDPTSGEHAQLPAQALGATSVVIFFAIDGHHTLLAALAASARAAPPGRVLAMIGPGEGLVRVGESILGDGLRIASPIVGTMLVVQVALGVVARTAPRLQIFALSFATAATVGLLALWLAVPSMLEAIARVIDALPARMDAALTGGG